MTNDKAIIIRMASSKEDSCPVAYSFYAYYFFIMCGFLSHN
ncbi:hypothetical protein BN177_180103 [Clostridioides difficile E24]|nr:hypothetical protein BN177_180103 [Clostridioides difficile E24]CCL44563.1 hypothetical protein BN178_150103 [Clostridioides difficile T42]CCL51474.1 hypothetical protein BN179_350011 [Clostridioides difficile T6]CCL55217.1 hypothetical protein BN180_270011 [Clostridioides difficile E14]CCL70855.1 hypothetical protein BN184_310011 [Clostridioides difficile T3]